VDESGTRAHKSPGTGHEAAQTGAAEEDVVGKAQHHVLALRRSFHRLTGLDASDSTAVAAWQSAHGLPPTGRVRKSTVDAARAAHDDKKLLEPGWSAGASTHHGASSGDDLAIMEPDWHSAERPHVARPAVGDDMALLELPEDAPAARVQQRARRSAPAAPSRPHESDAAQNLKKLLHAIDALLARFDKIPKPAGRHQPRANEGAQTGAPANADAMLSNLAIAEFVAAVKRVGHDWSHLSPDERMNRMVAAVNVELARERVPPCAGELGNPASEAAFHRNRWTITLRRERFNKPALELQAQDALAETVFHEARHADQVFKMACLLAGRKSPKQIAQQLGIDEDIAGRAFRIAPDSREGVQAQRYLDDMQSGVHEKIEETAEEIVDRGNRAHDLLAAIEADPHVTAHVKLEMRREFDQRRPRMRHAFEVYQSLATEQDSFAAQAKIQASFAK
jgi:hypothetical protein